MCHTGLDLCFYNGFDGLRLLFDFKGLGDLLDILALLRDLWCRALLS